MLLQVCHLMQDMNIQNSRQRVKRMQKIYVVLFDYRLCDMLSDDLVYKIRELNGANIILISAYELEVNIVTNLKQKNCIVVDIVQKAVGLTLFMGKIEQFV
jgi:response regulator RpfG family c-di-GMP phosphodiesterase